MNSTGERQIEIAFDDNRRLPLLYGEHNANLARIERQLGVSLATRGNVVSIAGPAHAAEMAQKVLADLWRRATNDQPVGPAEIDAALRFAPTSGPEDGATPGQDGPVIRTRRRTIAPRSPTQTRYLEAMERSELVFGIGPAGTGKTYLAVARAVAMLQSGRVDRIVISRPAIEAGDDRRTSDW